MNSAKLIFNEIDQSFFIDSISQGLAAVLVRTKRGPWGHDGSIVTSWPEFERKYGGETTSFEGPSLVQRALQSGANLRIGKVGHYATISNPASLDAVLGALDESGADFAVSGSDELFDLIVKYPGLDYNYVGVQIVDASNGDANSFDLIVTHSVDSGLNKRYQNLKIDGTPTVAESVYLKDVQEQDNFFDVVYKNLSALSGPLRPANGTWSVTGGTDGTAPADGDYSGSSTGKTGWFMFDAYEDFDALAALDNYNSAVMISGAAYTKNRGDHQNFHYFPESATTPSALSTLRLATNIDSRYSQFFAGGLKIPHPTAAGLTKNLPALGDILGIGMKSNAEFGPWWSFAGLQRGVIDNALGVVNNFPTTEELDQLAQKQINVIIQQGGRIYLKGNFSGQLATSKKSFASVVRLYIFLKKSLRPTLERYLEQPNDFRNFKEIYNEVAPFLDSLVGGDKRALVDYDWKGDQYANSDADLKINTRADLDQGKYRVKLWLKETTSLQEFTMDIISASSSVQFDANI